MPDDVVDEMVSEFRDIVESVRLRAFPKKFVMVPVELPDDNRDPNILCLFQEKAKLHRLAKLIIDYPGRDHGQEYIKVMAKRDEYARKIAESRIETDYKHQMKSEMKNSKYIYKIINSLIGKDSFSSTCHGRLSEDEAEELLKKNDATFVSDDYDEVEAIAAMNSFSERRYDVSTFNPEVIQTMIGRTIKIEPLVSKHAASLSTPIYYLVKAISGSNYYPKNFRTSKAAIIGKVPSERVIFSLEAIIKIVQKVLLESIDKCLDEEYAVNGDPGQMAYQKGRGVVSCNTIALTEIGISLKKRKEPMVMLCMDLKKAFNCVNRPQMIAEAQRQFGGGKLFKTYNEGRTYTYGSSIRGHDFNRGVPAGEPLGVLGFKLFINTDITFTLKNENIVWCNQYSDDRSPIQSLSKVLNGSFQEDIDKSVAWTKRMGVEYHTIGKKRPVMLLFTTPDCVPVDKKDLHLTCGPVKIEIVPKLRLLGLDIHTGLGTPAQNAIHDEMGFYTVPPNLSYLARRVEKIRDQLLPLFRYKMVESHIGGKMRFSSSIIYLCSSDADLDKARFNHGLAAAAVLGLSAYEALGASCCKHQTVKSDNIMYKNLLELCGLPSDRSMAISDSRVQAVQVFKVKADSLWFIDPDKTVPLEANLVGNQAALAVDEFGIPLYFADELNDVLLGKMRDLARCKLPSEEVNYVPYDINYLKVWEKTVNETDRLTMAGTWSGKELRDFQFRVYSDYMRYELMLLNQNHRRIHYQTPTRPLIKNSESQCSVRPREILGPQTGPIRPSLATDSSVIQVVYIRDKCLVCGELGPKGGWINSENMRWGVSNTNVSAWSWCVDDCGFGAHNRCIDFNSSLIQFEEQNQTACRKNFRCNDVIVQLTDRERCKMASDLRRQDTVAISKRSKSLKKSFKDRKRTRKRNELRYENDMTECKMCLHLYDLHTKDHLMSDCPKYEGPVITPKRSTARPKKRLCEDGSWNDQHIWDRLIFFHTYHPPNRSVENRFDSDSRDDTI